MELCWPRWTSGCQSCGMEPGLSRCPGMTVATFGIQLPCQGTVLFNTVYFHSFLRHTFPPTYILISLKLGWNVYSIISGKASLIGLALWHQFYL